MTPPDNQILSSNNFALKQIHFGMNAFRIAEQIDNFFKSRFLYLFFFPNVTPKWL